ncbi:MAG: AraC family transcriptional regulator [Psychromonas sp.]
MLPLINVDVVKPVIEVYLVISGKPSTDLDKFAIPYHVFEIDHGYFPSKPIVLFLNQILDELNEFQQEHFFELLIKEKLLPMNFAQFKQAPQTINQAIKQLISLSNIETPSAQLALHIENGEVWLTRQRILHSVNNELSSDLFSLYYFTYFISLLLAKPWHPNKVKIHTSDQDSLLNAFVKQHGCVLLRGQNVTAICLPIDLLDQPININKSSFAKQPLNTPPLNFIDSLLLSMEAYVGEESFNINQLATNLGVSVRTLQYKIESHGSTFKQLKSQVILNNAKWMMVHTKYSLTEISVYLGYSSIAHFSRAIKRLTGVSPRLYQKQLAED